MQRTEKRPTARRATAGLAVANFSERNNGDGRLSARPQGAHPIGQCGDAYRDVGNEREHAYREVGGRAMQGAIAEGRGSVAALGKDLSHCRRATPCLGRWGGLCTRQYQLDRVLVRPTIPRFGLRSKRLAAERRVVAHRSFPSKVE